MTPRRLVEGGTAFEAGLLRAAKGDRPRVPPRPHAIASRALAVVSRGLAPEDPRGAPSAPRPAPSASRGEPGSRLLRRVVYIAGALVAGLASTVDRADPAGPGSASKSSTSNAPAAISRDSTALVTPLAPRSFMFEPRGGTARSATVPAPSAPTPSTTARGTPPASAIDARPPADRDDELTLLRAARQAFAEGELEASGALLDRRDHDYPRGRFREEAAALRIEVLVARGDRAAAIDRARRFDAAYPMSPYALRVRSALDKAATSSDGRGVADPSKAR